MKDTSKDEILSYDQYAEIEKRGFTLPYVVEVQYKGQNLLFYGSEHTNNPEHLQYQDLEKRWDQFIATSAKPIALVEGRFDEVSSGETNDRTKSIIAGGEAQFVVHLARKDGVKVISPEPDRVWEAHELAKEFGRENVVFYYFIRQICWWSGLTKKPNIQEEAKKMLKLMDKLYKWEDVDFSIKRMEVIHEELFGKPLLLTDTQWIYDVTTPALQDYVTNELARRSGELRDIYILKQIKKYLREGRSPFMIFGSSHAIMLEPALRKIAS